jgi:hypothetical protein
MLSEHSAHNRSARELGIAKNLIPHFFLITTPKLKRAIVLKMMVFLHCVMRNRELKKIVRDVLGAIDSKQKFKLSDAVSDMYGTIV